MSKIIDLDKRRTHTQKQKLARRVLTLSHADGKVTAAMPKEQIRTIAESLERLNRLFEKLKEEMK
jgi:uncharacterized FAD-dependent dehydrogenase